MRLPPTPEIGTGANLVNQSQHVVRAACIGQLPETARPPGPDDPLGGRETKGSRWLDTGTYNGQESPHVFGQGQRTSSVSYPAQKRFGKCKAFHGD